MMNPLDHLYAKERVKELHARSEQERLLKPYKLSWRLRSAKALHGLANKLEPKTQKTLT
ncbi:MAG: hypothetical protein ACRCYY_20260 [Trueperaceae bacterium]